MGEEITNRQFNAADHARFEQRLAQETDLLQQWFETGRFASSDPVAGFELEAWLVDPQQLKPAAVNEAFLRRLANPLAFPELASFNFEVNSTPRTLTGHVFSSMHNELSRVWQQCRDTASAMDTVLMMTGILPTLDNDDLSLANMSDMERYRALNRESIRRRKGKPMVLDIVGCEHLRVTHRDVMLESATTSFQMHMQLNLSQSVRMFNASMILSAPLIALCANSPYLFGKDLWDETRIPLFEQAVALGGFGDAAFGPIQRVTFGSGYVRRSLFECFKENREHYPVLLPVEYEEPVEALHHLRFHNGTIWRWNRPLIGFNPTGFGEAGVDKIGSPHLRLEQRVVPAGPTVLDAIANAAFFYGVLYALGTADIAPESLLEFEHAKDNFYLAARRGLNATICWSTGMNGTKQVSVHELLKNELLPLAYQGLQQLAVSTTDIKEYLGIIEQRLETGINGARWQRAYTAKHGMNMQGLAAAYLKRQESGEPVHRWTV